MYTTTLSLQTNSTLKAYFRCVLFYGSTHLFILPCKSIFVSTGFLCEERAGRAEPMASSVHVYLLRELLSQLLVDVMRAGEQVTHPRQLVCHLLFLLQEHLYTHGQSRKQGITRKQGNNT